MTKLVIISALVFGACVTTDTEEVARLTDDMGPTNVVNEVEIPLPTPDYLDFGSVVITGIQIPGRESTATHFDLRTILEVEAFPYDIKLCALADGLDGTDVCSSLCDVQGFIARIHDDGAETSGSCRQHSCQLGSTIVNLDVCSPADS